MAPLEGPHRKKTEGARKKAAPLATALSAKRTTRAKAEMPPRSVVISEAGVNPGNGIVACDDAVRVSAYFKWVAAGRPEGDGVNFWLEAERELQKGT
ncbi:MAG: DUF2934 domain-containing protein [Deltaproteobacteria bacterium]